jgi:hypothetical protein
MAIGRPNGLLGVRAFFFASGSSLLPGAGVPLKGIAIFIFFSNEGGDAAKGYPLLDIFY